MLPALGPEGRGRVAQAAGGTGFERPRRRRAAGERRRAGQHRPAGRRLKRQPAAVPGRRREPGRERVELVMQPLAQRLERQHELATVRDGRQHRLDPAGKRGTPGALARQPDQRGAITVVGLEPTRRQLRPRRLRLRRSEQPQRPRPAPFQLGHPRPMQRPRRLDREHRRRRTDQPVQPLQPDPRARQRQRLADHAAPIGHPHPMRDLAGIDRDHQTIVKDLSGQPRHRTTPSTSTKKKTLPGSRRRRLPSTPL